MKKNLTDVLKGFPSSFIRDLSPERDCKETKDFLIYFYNIITLIEFAWAFSFFTDDPGAVICF